MPPHVRPELPHDPAQAFANGGSTKIEKVRRSLVVRVGEDTGGARVRVEGDTSDKATADAARRVLQVLTDRLS